VPGRARDALTGIVSAAFSPDSRSIAVLRRSEVLLLSAAGRAQRRVFASDGPLEGLSWSPDGRWLLVGWPAADQWLFLGPGPRHAAVPVGNVSAQFRSQTFPQVSAWCCGPG
jgi:WD40-like Beta Propeller Repeat